MWFGSGETFRYEMCAACGSLQLARIPADLGCYYPPEYFAAWEQPTGIRQSFRWALVTIRNWALLIGPSPVHWCVLHVPWFASRWRTHPLAPLWSRLRNRKISIADVGGGTGVLLRVLRSLGFQDLTCVDPYAPAQSAPEGIKLVRTTLGAVDRLFDLVMYHHTLEHVTDLGQELAALRSHLGPRGLGLVRLPMVPNAAFDRYQTQWVQIDPPRHVHIPSRRGLRVAIERAGLRVIDEGCDSGGFQFWGSELAVRRIPHLGGAHGLARELFTAKQIRAFDRCAYRLNREGRGDQRWVLVEKDGERQDGTR
jgi:SAM-dependent methyltransferase